MEKLRDFYRRSRVLAKQAVRLEPRVAVDAHVPLEFHGTRECGWSIPRASLTRDSVVVDVGLGEDIAFSTSLIGAYGCRVHGFDPTPRAVAYVNGLRPGNFVLHEVGLGAESGPATFYLPNNTAHVSGSLVREAHLGQRQITVDIVGMREMFAMLDAARLAILKLDIEGAEYALIGSRAFAELADRIDTLCIEFHHRWQNYGADATRTAVATLNRLGFRCAWRADATNEEFMFVNCRTGRN